MATTEQADPSPGLSYPRAGSETAENPSPVVSDIAAPTAAPPTNGTVNGLTASGPEKSTTPGIGSRSGTPHTTSHPSTPSLASVHTPAGPPPASASHQQQGSSSLPPGPHQVANGTGNGNGNGTGVGLGIGPGAGAHQPTDKPTDKPLRWRDPMTVKYDGQQVQPGVLVADGYARPTSQSYATPSSATTVTSGQQQAMHPGTYTGAPAPAPSQPPPASGQHSYLLGTQPHVSGAPVSASQPVPPSSAPPYRHQHQPRQHPKPLIIDPPGSYRAGATPTHQQPPRAAPAVSGFPSPAKDYARENQKFVDDCTRITFAIQQSLPESVRRIIRDNWEKCLLGSDFHQAFILNAAIHHSVPSITRRAVRDFGARMVHDCKDELAKHFTAQDIDEIADFLISKASDRFLDKCLEKRLPSIQAKTLINALARAERLGYEKSDIVEEDHVAAPPAPAVPAPTRALSQPGHPPRSQQWHCLECFRTFRYESAYHHHTSKKVCSKPPPTAEGFKFSCEYCGQGFATVAGQQYHKANNVCVDLNEPRPFEAVTAVTPGPLHRGPGRPPRVPAAVPASPANILPSTPHGQSAQYTPNGSQSSGRQKSLAQQAAAAASPGIQSDPYGHLTPEQLQAMNAELADAESKYGPRFKEAEQIANPEERRLRVDGLRNSFGTKQSMIRKKYGVRLRERRTKAVIEAERERMGIKKAEESLRQERTLLENAAAQAMRVTQQHQYQLQQPQGAISGAIPGTIPGANASGWVAANSAKRSRDETEEPEAKRIRTNEIDAGINSGIPAATSYAIGNENAVAQQSPAIRDTSPATTLDPAQPPPESHQPDPAPGDEADGRDGSDSSGSSPATVGGAPHASPSPVQQPNGTGTTHEAEVIAVDSDSSDDDGDDGDIPATLPANVRDTFTR